MNCICTFLVLCHGSSYFEHRSKSEINFIIFLKCSYFAFLVSVIIIFKIYIFKGCYLYEFSFVCFFTERHADFLSLLHTFNLLIRRKSTKTEFFLTSLENNLIKAAILM